MPGNGNILCRPRQRFTPCGLWYDCWLCTVHSYQNEFVGKLWGLVIFCCYVCFESVCCTCLSPCSANDKQTTCSLLNANLTDMSEGWQVCHCFHFCQVPTVNHSYSYKQRCTDTEIWNTNFWQTEVRLEQQTESSALFLAVICQKQKQFLPLLKLNCCVEIRHFFWQTGRPSHTPRQCQKPWILLNFLLRCIKLWDKHASVFASHLRALGSGHLRVLTLMKKDLFLQTCIGYTFA